MSVLPRKQPVRLHRALPKNGGKPVYGVYSTFIQRTYDRLSQDLCINSNPADILAQNRLTKEQIVYDILSL